VHHLPTHPPPAACARPATAFAPQHSLRVRLASAIRAPVARLSSGRVALPTRRLVPSDHIHSLTHLVLASVSSRGVLHVTVRPRPQPIPGSFLTPNRVGSCKPCYTVGALENSRTSARHTLLARRPHSKNRNPRLHSAVWCTGCLTWCTAAGCRRRQRYSYRSSRHASWCGRWRSPAKRAGCNGVARATAPKTCRRIQRR
jgi:hypothetical protein